MFVFILICVLIGVVLAFVLASGDAVLTLFSSPIECPACGRKIKVRGTSARCYKCKSKLFKHANGQYMVRH